MKDQTMFKKHYSKLALEGVLKALICASIVGLVLSFVTALIALLATVTLKMPYDVLWLSIGIGLGAIAVATPSFYFMKFRPTTKKVAERVDRLGLEERLITMLELQKDESYIAMCQREDAKEKLSANRKPIKFKIFKVPVVMLAVVAVLSISMITTSTIIARGMEPPEVFLNVKYEVEMDERGYFRGGVAEITDAVRTVGGKIEEYEKVGNLKVELKQVVSYGKAATKVRAIPNTGYRFLVWSDGLEEDERTDENVEEEFTVVAIFVETFIKANYGVQTLVSSGGTTEDGTVVEAVYEEGRGGFILGQAQQLVLPGADATTVMAVADDGYAFIRWSDDSEDEYEGNPIRTDLKVQDEIEIYAVFVKLSEGTGGGSGGVDPGTGLPGGDGAGGSWNEDQNKILDGDTDYHHVYELMYEEVKRILSTGGTVPDYIMEIIESYFGAVL